MNAILQDQPLPARLVPWPKATLTSLQRCLVLAFLVHLWLVLWLGNAPGGTAPLGQGVFGAINITLRGPLTEGVSEVLPPPAPANAVAGPGAAPRWGGAVRQTEPLPDSAPGAARLGRTVQQPDSSAPAPTPLPSLPTDSSPLMPAQPPVLVPVPLPMPATAPMPLPSPRAAPAPTPAPPPVPVPLPTALPTTTLVKQPAVESALPVPAPEMAAEVPVERRIQAPAATLRAPQAALSPSPPLPSPAAPDAGNLPRLETPPGRPGAPDAGAQVGRDVATPAAAAASAVPRLNLELARPRGGELSRYGTAGVLPVLPRPPERDEKLARDIEKSGRADCRTAHGAMGILAVIPLVVDAVKKDGGCKW